MSKIEHKCHKCKNEVTEEENWAIDDDGYLCEKCDKAEDKIEGEIEVLEISNGFVDILAKLTPKEAHRLSKYVKEFQSQAISQAKSNTIKEMREKIEEQISDSFKTDDISWSDLPTEKQVEIINENIGFRKGLRETLDILSELGEI